ncbi:hypothetical protein C8Q78DRAFT_224355 [Trametes maxima]|nr:hypothetical protein C8Q78DRAFT_224355 [Trametes maxima]
MATRARRWQQLERLASSQSRRASLTPLNHRVSYGILPLAVGFSSIIRIYHMHLGCSTTPCVGERNEPTLHPRSCTSKWTGTIWIPSTWTVSSPTPFPATAIATRAKGPFNYIDTDANPSPLA